MGFPDVCIGSNVCPQVILRVAGYVDDSLPIIMLVYYDVPQSTLTVVLIFSA